MKIILPAKLWAKFITLVKLQAYATHIYREN